MQRGRLCPDGMLCTPARRGPTFVRTKVGKIRLGLCPKTPVAGCAGYGLIFDGSPKSIRTAHRIAPKVATGVSALSPHPLSRWRERGSDGRASAGRQFGARGMLGLAEGAGRGGWGFGAERRRWRMKRGGESVAVEKIEQTNSAKIFSGTARR